MRPHRDVRQPWGPNYVTTGRRAVVLAMPPFVAQLKENGRDPV